MWNQGRKSKKPVVIGERQYSEKRVQKTKKDFDPRRPDTVCKGKESTLKITRLLNRMKCITYENQLSTGIFSPSAWEISLKDEFTDYALSSDRKNVLSNLVNQLTDSLQFRAEGPKEITDGKQRTEEWFLVRKLLITASEVKTFTLPKTCSQLFTVVKNHLWDDVAQIISSAIQHGQRNEHNAFVEYKEHMAPWGLEAKETGLWINPLTPKIIDFLTHFWPLLTK